MYDLYITDFNYAAVLGVCLGIYIIFHLDTLVRDVMNFVRGWRSM